MYRRYRFPAAALKTKIRSIIKVQGLFPFYLKYYGRLQMQRFVEKRLGRREIIPIVSYPCSGRSWLDTMMIFTLAKEMGCDPYAISTTCEITVRNKDWPIIDLTHARSSWETHGYASADARKMGPECLGTERAIFLWRDPRDVVVSSYHHIRARSGVPDLTRTEMVSDPVVGIDKIIAFMNVWAEAITSGERAILPIQYENLRKDTNHEMRKLFDFVRISVGESSLQFGIDEAEFSRMQEKERSGTVPNPRFLSTDSTNPAALKTRKGKSGEYREFFETHDREQLERRIENNLHPLYRKELKLNHVS